MVHLKKKENKDFDAKKWSKTNHDLAQKAYDDWQEESLRPLKESEDSEKASEPEKKPS